jgi:Galactose oxidase, central domain
MPGIWTTFDAPNTSTGPFAADLMILLTDGSLLIHNAYVSSIETAKQWLRLTPDQNGKYETGSWSAEIDMKNARQWFASGVLKDGRVYAIGGEYSDDPLHSTDSPLGETFDPQTNQWTAISKPSAFDFVRGDCNGSVLEDGRVLLGGAAITAPPSTWPKRTAIWNPANNSWVEAGTEFGAVSNTKTDSFEEETFALLPHGSVLAPAVRDTPKAQRYVPLLDRWVNCAPSPVKLAVRKIAGTGVYETGPTIVLPSGKAFAIGGPGRTAIFTPGPNPTSPGSWIKGPVFPPDTSSSPILPLLTALDAPACLLPSGKVVIMAGTTAPDGGDYFSLNPVLLEYDPSNSATTLPELDVQPSLPAGNFTWQSCFLLLPTGQLLCSAQSNTLFLYTPDPSAGAPLASWRPAHISVPSNMSPGHSYTLTGTQINGLSQAVGYGDDAGMATNYPIVRLTHPSTGQVVYLRSHKFSTMGIATGSAVPHDRKSCTIDIPSSLADGKWKLAVIANGIPSEAIWVEIGLHGHEHRFEGKIESLVYDSFGDFEAFTVQSTGGEHRRFDSHEPHVAELTRRAWLERTRVMVFIEPDHPHHAESIALLA